MSKLDEYLRDYWDDCLDFAEDSLPSIIYEDWCSDALDCRHIPLIIDDSEEFVNAGTTGEVEVNRRGQITGIAFNPIVFTKKRNEIYSCILHEICHIAAVEEDLRTGNFDYDKYRKNCHNKTWQKYADRLNRFQNSKGEKINIVKDYSRKEYKKELDRVAPEKEDKMRESLISNSKLIFTSEEDQKDYDSQIAIVKEAKRIGYKIIDDAIFQMAKAAEQFPDAIDGDPIWLLGSHLYGIEHADKLFEAYKAAKEALDNE